MYYPALRNINHPNIYTNQRYYEEPRDSLTVSVDPKEASTSLFLSLLVSQAYKQYSTGKFIIPTWFNSLQNFRVVGELTSGVDNVPLGYVIDSDEYTIVVIRGTKGDLERSADLDTCQVPFTEVKGGGLVHRGFYIIYSCGEGKSFRSQMFNILKSISNPEAKTLYLTGHSLGGAMATLSALDVKSNLNKFRNLAMYNFGSPRVGDPVFASKYNSDVGQSRLWVNQLDPVPKLPSGSFYCSPYQEQLTPPKCQLPYKPEESNQYKHVNYKIPFYKFSYNTHSLDSSYISEIASKNTNLFIGDLCNKNPKGFCDPMNINISYYGYHSSCY